MERVLGALNPEDGTDYVVVYINDVLMLSQILKDHLEHLHRVIRHIQDAGLKLNIWDIWSLHKG